MEEQKILEKYVKGGINSLTEAECLEAINTDTFLKPESQLSDVLSNSDNINIQLFRDIFSRYSEQKNKDKK